MAWDREAATGHTNLSQSPSKVSEVFPALTRDCVCKDKWVCKHLHISSDPAWGHNVMISGSVWLLINHFQGSCRYDLRQSHRKSKDEMNCIPTQCWWHSPWWEQVRLQSRHYQEIGRGWCVPLQPPNLTVLGKSSFVLSLCVVVRTGRGCKSKPTIVTLKQFI